MARTLMAIMHKCVPTKTLGKRRNPPWLTGSIVRHTYAEKKSDVSEGKEK